MSIERCMLGKTKMNQPYLVRLNDRNNSDQIRNSKNKISEMAMGGTHREKKK